MNLKESFNAILIDDEQLAINALSHLLSIHCPEIKVVNTFTNPVSAKNYLDSTPIDIAFIDIKMPRANGLDIVRSLKDSPTKYIFSTAYSDYALEAWQCNAVGYILKPIDPEDLITVVNKTKHLINPADNIYKYNLSGNQIDVKDILYGEADGSYTQIFDPSMQSRTISLTAKKVLAILPKKLFFRVHRDFFINALYISSYNSKTRELELESGVSMHVSVRKATEFLEFLKQNGHKW